MRERASWMSASVGAVRCVANLEHLLKDLTHGRQRIELAPLHLVEQPPQLRIVGHRPLEVRLRATGRDGEDFARQVLAPPLLQPPLRLEVRPVLLDLRPELGNVLSVCGVGEYDRRSPGTVTV